MATQTLLRLRVNEAGLDEHLNEHPLIRSALSTGPVVTPLAVTHYDTLDLKLDRQGIHLTVSPRGEIWEMRLQRAGKKGGFSRKLTSAEPDFGKVNKAGRKLLGKVKVAELVPLFTVAVERTSWTMRFPDRGRMLLAWERGTIKGIKGEEVVNELILEAQGCELDRLFQTALSLGYAFRPGMEGMGVVERAFTAFYPENLRPVTARSVKAAPKSTTEEMFADVNWRLMDQLRHNQNVVLRGDALSEGVLEVHRILSRMRFLMSMYDSVIAKEISSDLDEEVKSLLAELRPATQWDNFMTGTLGPFANYFPDYPTLADLRQAAERERNRAHDRAREALRSFRFTRLILGLGLWITSRSWREMMERRQRQQLDQTMATFAKESMSGYHDEMVALGKGFAELSGNRFDEFCDSCDRLARACWFFSSLFKGRKSEEYDAHLVTLRGVLLARNDVEEADDLFNQLISEEQDSAIHLFKGWQGNREENHRQESEAAWKTFTKHPIYWK